MNEHEIARILGSGWPEILAGVMLGGPLVAWVVYRLAFPAQGKAATRAVTGVVRVPHDALWLCGTCLSLNRPGARRCYRCLAVRATTAPADGRVMQARPMAEPTPPSWVAVMAQIAPVPAAGTQAGHWMPLPAPATPSAPEWVRTAPEPVLAGVEQVARPPVGVMAPPRALPVAMAVGGDPADGSTARSKPLCPLLRGIGDARIVFMLPQPMPHRDYRCQAGQRPVAIESTRQAAYCLSAEYRSCERYVALAHRVSGMDLPEVPETNAAAVRSELSG